MHQLTRIQTAAQEKAVMAPAFASILIVDDSDFDRARLKKLCLDFDFTTHVVEAASLNAMQDKLRKDRFDLILLDYHLDDGTGLDGVEIIRADVVNANAAIVMITGTEQSDIALQALRLGFTDYLTKDEISAETFGRTAHSALQKCQFTRAAAAQSGLDAIKDETVQSFSKGCAQDVKPIVSRIMRQMRSLRDIDQMKPEDVGERIERVEASLRSLWAFLDELDYLGSTTAARVPSLPEEPSLNMPRDGSNARRTQVPSIFKRRTH